MCIESTRVAGSTRTKLYWFGQSSYCIRNEGGPSLMIDPYFPLWRPEAEFLHPAPPIDESNYPVDVVLVTHDHRDHNCPDSLRRILVGNPHAHFYGPYDVCQRWEHCSMPKGQCHIVAAGDSISLQEFTIQAVYSKPTNGDSGAGIAPPDVEHLGYVVKTRMACVYFSGDPIHNFHQHNRLVDSVKVCQPEIAVINMHPTEGELPFFDGAWLMAQRIGCHTVVPSHYGCFRRRTYDPRAFAQLAPKGIKPLIITYHSCVEL